MPLNFILSSVLQEYFSQLLTFTMTANQDFSASGAVDNTTVSSSRNTRFMLRKKRNFNERNKEDSSPVNLSSYNSDFLSGLFADVAKANVLKELSIELPSSSSESSSQTKPICSSRLFDDISSSHIVSDSMNSPRPLKKSRVSLRSSSHRSHASGMHLLATQDQASKGISSSEKKIPDVKQDSLAYQLDCLERSENDLSVFTKALHQQGIASVSPTRDPKKGRKDVAAIAFPNLPSTVSDSSCESNNVASTGLTRERCQIQQGSAPENTAFGNNSSKESFGWFVDLDDNEEPPVFSRTVDTDSTVHGQNLAFQAPTNSKQATNHIQEEMEQAYAADTIDSVLGDFF